MSKKSTMSKKSETTTERSDVQTLAHVIIPQPAPVAAGAQQMLEQARSFAVANADDYKNLAATLRVVGDKYDVLEKQRVDLKAPSLEAGRRVDAFFKPALDALEEAKKIIRKKLSEYDDEQRRIAAQKQREAEEEARRAREALERQKRAEQERLNRLQHAIGQIQGLLAIAQKCTTLDGINETLDKAINYSINPAVFEEMTETAQMTQRSTVMAIEAHKKTFIANQAAQNDAAAARKAQVEARAAEMRAQEEAAAVKAKLDAAETESRARQAALDQQASNTVAERVETTLVEDAGVNRVTTYDFRIIDKMKLKPEFLLPDEKSIRALVRTSKKRAAEMVGIGAIEVIESTNVRTGR